MVLEIAGRKYVGRGQDEQDAKEVAAAEALMKTFCRFKTVPSGLLSMHFLTEILLPQQIGVEFQWVPNVNLRLFFQ